jgi:hypothetical protein
MATVNGTPGNDFIHVSGDGRLPPAPGFTDNANATDSDDTINSGGGGKDFIFAGDGADAINFGSDLDSTDRIYGEEGNDTVFINDQVTVTFGIHSLTDIERIQIPDISLPVGTGGPCKPDDARCKCRPRREPVCRCHGA